MGVYYFVFIFITIFGLFEYLTGWRWIGFVSALPLILLAGTRWMTGNDFLSYQSIFYNLNSSIAVKEISDIEWGFTLINKVFGSFFSFEFFIFFYSTCTIILLTIFLFKTDVLPNVSMALLFYYSRYFFIRDMGQIRSSLAAVICLFAIKYIFQKKFLTFIMIIILASSIHTAAFIYIPIYFWCNFFNKKITLKKTISWFVFAAIFALIYPVFIPFFSSIFPRYISYINTFGSQISVAAIICIMIIGLYFFSRTKEPSEDQNALELSHMVNIYIFGALFLIAFTKSPGVGGRLATLPLTLEIVILPTLINKDFGRYLGYLIMLFVCIAVFVIIFSFNVDKSQYIPYISFLSFIR